MATTNGKWKLVSDENVEEFIKATGGGDKELKEYLASKKNEVYEKFAVDGDRIKETTEDGTKTSSVEIQLGKWCDIPEGDNVSKLLVKELGTGEYAYSIHHTNYKATGTRVFTDDDMVLTITVTGAGVTGTRRYKRVK